MTELPVKQIIPSLREALSSSRNAVLISPPGSGKSTFLPLQLLNEGWLTGKRIIMLEPRRLAARNVAFWLAHQLGEEIGQTVGYRMRGDTVIGKSTRLEVVTEGILTRLLQKNPELENYGLVIFDEFHERNLNSDLALTLCLDLQQNLRDDMRMLVMSATLEAQPVASLLNNAVVITSEGRSYPVTIHYSNSDIELRNTSAMVSMIQKILQTETGDVLVFLPGAIEIQRLHEALTLQLADSRIVIYPLFGSLTQAQQELAIAPSVEGQRKIVLSTNIAETSLTIEGIRVVIDSGYQRQVRYHPGSGLTRLDTLRVAKSNADQRCGRAGRLGPGVCFRLWTENTQRTLLLSGDPEILHADLTSLVLELAQWGVRDLTDLAWVTPPLPGSFLQAQTLLRQLGALSETNLITAHGRHLLELGTHPRLAHMMVKAEQLGLGMLACDLAALLNERDILVNSQTGDLQLRLETLRQLPHTKGIPINRAIAQRVRNESLNLQKQLNLKNGVIDTENTGLILAMAYPDRIAKKRKESTTQYVLSNGKGAVLSEADSLCSQQYLVVSDLDGRQQNARIFFAASIEEKQIVELFAAQITKIPLVYWDKKETSVKSLEQTRLFDLVLHESRMDNVDEQQILRALLAGIREEGIESLCWSEAMRQWQKRVILVRQSIEPQWPDVSNTALIGTLEEWLAPYLLNLTRLSQITEQIWQTALTSILNWNQQQQLDKLAPTHIQVPSGSQLRIDYCEGDVPVLRVRLQEMFGLATTPCILNGKLQLLLYLLSPAQRPIQVTRDLSSFWQNTYIDVKKDLKGRYPKHYWPDNPLEAEATRRIKPGNSNSR